MVDNPYSITFLVRTPIFEWYVVWYGFKNKCQIDCVIKKLDKCAQYVMTILDSIANINSGDLYDHLYNEHEDLHFENDIDNIHMSSKNYAESHYGLDLDLLTILVLIACFQILGEVGKLKKITI
jgi:hypothetical protein